MESLVGGDANNTSLKLFYSSDKSQNINGGE